MKRALSTSGSRASAVRLAPRGIHFAHSSRNAHSRVPEGLVRSRGVEGRRGGSSNSRNDLRAAATPQSAKAERSQIRADGIRMEADPISCRRGTGAEPGRSRLLLRGDLEQVAGMDADAAAVDREDLG